MARGMLFQGQWKIPKDQSREQFQKELGVTTSDAFTTNQLAEDHKYHLYVTMACPFANSARIALSLKNLEGDDKIGISLTSAEMDNKGWCFDSQHSDRVYNKKFLWELYVLDGNSFTGRASVPLLIDITDGKPVCNQSVDLMRMFNKFGDPNTPNLFPDVPGFEAMLTRIVKELNEGAYRAAAAPNQQDYDNSVNAYFSALDEFEERLSNTRFLWSNDDITACDIRLFVTLIRWEFVYHNLFDLNKKNTHPISQFV